MATLIIAIVYILLVVYFSQQLKVCTVCVYGLSVFVVCVCARVCVLCVCMASLSLSLSQSCVCVHV